MLNFMFSFFHSLDPGKKEEPHCPETGDFSVLTVHSGFFCPDWNGEVGF